MARKITLQVFADPGHAWARFPKARLQALGIADKVSTYSYQRGQYAFLEEDCDLSLLIKALRERGYEVKFKEAHTNRQSKIRGYDHYRVNG
jgi:N-acetyl-anhydromuramyl-L-alanine amidase AmpD